MGPSTEQVTDGEGAVNRDLLLVVDRVVWTNPKAADRVPERFHYVGLGWLYKGDDLARSRKMAQADTPRLEVGHTYVMALQADSCPGSGQFRWHALDGDAVIPFDGGVLGQGESSGELVGPEDERRSASDPNYSVEDRIAGNGLDNLVDLLKQAPEVPRARLFRPAVPCT